MVGLITKVEEIAICTAVASAAEARTFFLPGDFVVISACKTGFHALRRYCDTLGKAVAGTSPADNVINFLQRDSILLQPYAIFPAGNRVDGDSQILKIIQGASGLLPYSFTIEDDATQPFVNTLEVFPEDPAPHEDYVVYVTYICSNPSVVVQMHIIGTDQYEDTTMFYGIDDFCVLYVPGAEELVMDFVTIQITTSNGFSFTRQVVIVFCRPEREVNNPVCPCSYHTTMYNTISSEILNDDIYM